MHDVDGACAFDIAIPKWRSHIPAGLVSGALVQAPPFLVGWMAVAFDGVGPPSLCDRRIPLILM
jgi:hypothetical protein